MMMKMCGYENISASDFYRILGDDSVISYPSQDEDQSPYKVHSYLCDEVSLIKNDAKTGKSFYSLEQDDYSIEILDFAKVSVSEGKFLTPVPSGLAQKYGSTFEDRLALVLWYNDHGVTFKKWAYKLLLTKFGKDPIGLFHALSVFSSGEIPYLSNFKDDYIFESIDSSVSGISLYSYGYSELQNSVIGYFVSDEDKAVICRKNYSFEKLWEGMIKMPILNSWSNQLSEEHKFNVLMLEARDKISEISDLFDIGDPELVTCIGALLTRNNILEDLRYTLSRVSSMRQVSNDEEFWLNATHFSYKETFCQKDILGSLEVRSLRLKESNRAHFLRKSLRNMKEYEKFLPKSEMVDSLLKILDYFDSIGL
jgi:hypothetical protein